MLEIKIDRFDIKYFINCLESTFQANSKKIKNETLIEFNNEFGEGNVSVFPIHREMVSTTVVKFRLKKSMSFHLFDFNMASINFIYLTKGYCAYEKKNKKFVLSDLSNCNLIIDTKVNESEVITFPADTLIEFSFIKIFDLNYLKGIPSATNLSKFQNNGNSFKLDELSVEYLSGAMKNFDENLASLKKYEGKGYFKDYISKRHINLMLSMQLDSLKDT